MFTWMLILSHRDEMPLDRPILDTTKLY